MVIGYEIVDLIKEIVQFVEGDLRRERLVFIIHNPCCCITVECRNRWDTQRWEQHVDIQCRENDKVLARVILSCDEYVPSLSGCQAKHFFSHVFWFHIDSINGDGSHIMALKPDGNTREIGHVDHANQICLSWFHLESIVLTVVDKACIGDWGLPRLDGIVVNIGGGLVVVEECGHVLMIPIREGHCELFVEMVWRIRIVNDERAPQAVWVLTLSVRVVPIRACLIDLIKLLVHNPNQRGMKLTGNA